METVTIVIAGGRGFDDYDYLQHCMDAVKYLYSDHEITVVSGGARGADTLAEQWAGEQHLVFNEMNADWERFGKRAGLLRNHDMAKIGNVLCAFWDGKTRGTRNMIGEAMKEGLEIHIFRYA